MSLFGGRGGLRRRQDDNLGVNIPSFQGRADPDAYLAWERKVELMFDYQDYSELKKVKLAANTFAGYALTWWDQFVKNRRRYGEEPIETWKEMKAVMRKRYAPSHYYPAIHTDWRRSKVADVSYSKRSFWEEEEQPNKVRRPYVWDDSSFNSKLEVSKEKIMGILKELYEGVVTKNVVEDPKMTVMEEVNEEVEEIEAPSGPLTLFGDGVPSVHNQDDDEEQMENLFDVEDEVSLAPEQVCESQVQLQVDVKMVESKEEKVETKKNALLHESLLVGSGELEMVMTGEKFVEANVCKGKVLLTNDLDHLSPSIYYVQDFEVVVPDVALSSILPIRGNEHQIELKGLKEFEEFEEKKKLNFFPFDVGGDQDLRTNPLQEEGNDVARRSWNSVHGPRIKDDMG